MAQAGGSGQDAGGGLGVAERKQALRAEVKAALAALRPARRALEEEAVTAAIQDTPEWRAARTVLLYAAKPPEFSVVGLTLAAWREGKRTLFPRVVAGAARPTLELCEVTSWADLQPGAFGVKEPAAALPAVTLASSAGPALDLAIIPGLAFDETGRRLGRGGGFYDALLAGWRGSGACWGVAFDCQIVRAVPWEPHDCTVDAVWTCRTKQLLDR